MNSSHSPTPILASIHQLGHSLAALRQARSRQTARGFSLVEVALALGIVSFGLVSMLGLMPIGLEVFRESIQSTVQTDILRELGSHFQSMPFQDVQSSTEMTYYTDQGVPTTNPESALFGVTYAVDASTPLLATADGYSNDQLKTVRVSFYTNRDRAKTPPEPSMTDVLFVPPGVN